MLTCIVLAAGASKRLGRPKQLVRFEGEPLVLRAAKTASAVGRTIIIIPDDPAVAEVLHGYQTLVNPHREEGMASSIRAGVEAAPDGDILIVLADQPLITVAHLQALVDADAPIAATAYAGSVGVPAFFSAKFRGELLALRGDVGAKRVIEQHRAELVPIRFEPAAVDVDTDSAISR